jgi:glycosyltransferase involved in cell wall biosynthesis
MNDTTLCLIVLNEADQIAECINSFKGIFSEILIIDTGSTDNTVKIAKKLGANVIPYKWENDFSKARNFALSKVKTNWTLIADADDRITEKNKIKLIELFDKFKNNFSIFSFPYIYSTNTGDRIRLIKTNLNLKYIYPVHELLVIPEKFKKLYKKINIPFLHVKKESDFQKGFKRNCKIMNKFIKTHPTDLRILYYLIHDNFSAKNYKKTIFWCKKYLNNKPYKSYLINKVFARQGISYLRLNNHLKAIESFILAIAATPELIEPYLYLGDIYLNEKKIKEALQFYIMAKTCKVPQNTEHFFNFDAYSYYANLKLTDAYVKIGDYRSALKYAEEAKIKLPNDKKLMEKIEFIRSKL